MNPAVSLGERIPAAERCRAEFLLRLPTAASHRDRVLVPLAPPPAGKLEAFAANARIVHIDIDPAEVSG